MLRILWWLTIAIVLVGVGLSDAFDTNQPLIFGLGGLGVVAVLVLHELLPERWHRRDPALSTVGRLDKETSGLLLLTDDGGLLHRIIAPKANVAKRYRVTLDRLLQSVSPREREVLRPRFAEDLTQAEIGALIGVSQMQVSRIIRQSLARLRTVAESDA